MERFGQILFSLKGHPEKASNQKKQIFEKYYDEIFSESNLIIENAPTQIKRYFEIKREYDLLSNTYEVNEQKIFYILYIDNFLNLDIYDIIIKFEELIIEYKPTTGKEIADSRKIIQIQFKEYLDENFGIIK